MLNRQGPSRPIVYENLDRDTDDYEDQNQEAQCDKTGLQQRKELYVCASELAALIAAHRLFRHKPSLVYYLELFHDCMFAKFSLPCYF